MAQPRLRALGRASVQVDTQPPGPPQRGWAPVGRDAQPRAHDARGGQHHTASLSRLGAKLHSSPSRRQGVPGAWLSGSSLVRPQCAACSGSSSSSSQSAVSFRVLAVEKSCATWGRRGPVVAAGHCVQHCPRRAAPARAAVDRAPAARPGYVHADRAVTSRAVGCLRVR